jgi:hypothetical protein
MIKLKIAQKLRNFVVSTALLAGKAGLVPAPSAGSDTRYLSATGWKEMPATGGASASNYVAPTSTSAGTAGLVAPPSFANIDGFFCADGTWKKIAIPAQTTYSVFGTNTATAAGTEGLVPGPAIGADNRYLSPKGWTDFPTISGVSTGNYVAPTSTSASAAGLVPPAAYADLDAFLSASGLWKKISIPTYSVFKAGTALAVGEVGLVPAPAAGIAVKVLTTGGWSDFPAQVSYSDFAPPTSTSAGTAGLVPSATAGTLTRYLSLTGWKELPAFPTIPTYSAFIGSSSSTTGTSGLVPTPQIGDEGKFLSGAGVWTTISTTTGAVYTVFGKSKEGLVPAFETADAGKILSTSGWITAPTGTGGGSTPVYVGATASADGVAGSVPAATMAQRSMALFGDGSWKNISFNVANHTVGAAYAINDLVFAPDGSLCFAINAVPIGTQWPASLVGSPWRSLLSNVSTLVGLDIAAKAQIAVADTYVVALGKLQGQLNSLGEVGRTYSKKQVYSSTTEFPIEVKNATEVATFVAAAPTTMVNYEISEQSVLYFTVNTISNFTINFRFSSTVPLVQALEVGKSVTVTLVAQHGAYAYIPTIFQIDGTAVTPKWLSGETPTTANTNSTETYTFTIIRDSVTSFRVLASTSYYK